MAATKQVEKPAAAGKPKPAKTASHPPYFEMIKEALASLSEKSGSSPYAIAKFMEEKHKSVLPANFRKILGLQLKNSAIKGKLVKVKASYKLSDAGKKDKAAVAKPAAKKIAGAKAPTKKAASSTKTKKLGAARTASAATMKKPKTTKTAAAVASGTKRKADALNKAVTKKVVAKATPVKKKVAKKVAKKATPAKPKQPKIIKSPAAKRARKAVAA